MLDAARVFRLGLETAPAGSVLHAIADQGVAIRTVAEVIGRHLGLPVRAVSPGLIDDLEEGHYFKGPSAGGFTTGRSPCVEPCLWHG